MEGSSGKTRLEMVLYSDVRVASSQGLECSSVGIVAAIPPSMD